ncbi:uncharacterized protein LAESUDRAFT_666199, partial [Laetiporus sulphureus 93-53]
PITDSEGRVIGVLAGSPNDPSWQSVNSEASALLKKAQTQMHFTSKMEKHLRGDYPALSVGVSFGGGQKCPGNLVNLNQNAMALATLLKDQTFIRIAGFASAAFKIWAPCLYDYYVDHLRPLYEKYPQLQRNFDNSVFPCATFNFGPAACTVKHRDVQNLPFGWCAITALGDFDPKLGGHFVLWDMKLVIEFPPGATILIPSAIVQHSNVVIQSGETRYSVTQYAAGGLFRWVDQGFQSMSAYLIGLTDSEQVDEKRKAEERWKDGIGLFSHWLSYQQNVNSCSNFV